MVLLAGATGSLGRHIAVALAARGRAVRGLVRSAGWAGPTGAGEHVGDLARPETLRGACGGAEAVISCAGASMNLRRLGDRASFEKIDYLGNRALLEEAKRAGVRHFVYVSLAGVDRLRHTAYVEAHERFVSDLRSSGMSHTVLRPTGFFATVAELVGMARRGPVPVIGDGTCRSNPVHEADVAAACVAALDTEAPEVVMGGPDAFTRRQMAELACRAVNMPERVRSVAPGVVRAVLPALRMAHPRMHGLIEFGLEVSLTDVLAPPTGTRRLEEYLRRVAASPGAAATARV